MNNNVQCLSNFNRSLSAIFSLCLLTRAKHLNMHLQVNITLAPRLHLNYGRSRCNDHAENKLICDDQQHNLHLVELIMLLLLLHFCQDKE